MSNWNPVSDYVSFSTKGITPEYVDNSSIVVLNQKCIRNHRIDYSFAQYTDDSKNISETKFVKKGDILVNSTGEGTAGRCAFVPELPDNKRLIVDSHILILRCNSFFKAQCLSYILFSSEDTLMSFMTGSSGQSELDKVVLLNLKTKMPTDPTIQQKIASVLSALDSKIEINNRINAELEAMAKTLYDYWFVQFDFPDKNGKLYKSNGGKMVWSEKLKRKIPEGWKDGLLDDIGEIIGGSTPSKKVTEYFTTNGTAWITPKDLSMNIGNKFITKGEIDVSNAGIKSASLNLMPKGTVLLSSRAPIGYMAISRDIVTTNQGFKSLIPREEYTTPFVFYAVKNSLSTIINNASGSTFKEISGSTLKTISTCLPADDIIKKYTTQVEAIFKKQSALELENQNLSELRDWLLPMLMNGQVKINNASTESSQALNNPEVLPISQSPRFI